MAVVAVDALLGFAGLVLLLSAVGLLAMRDAIDKLHYVTPATTLAPIAIALAIILEDGFTSQAGLKSLCVAFAVVVSSPIVSYATLRAIQTRELGRPDPTVEPVLQE